MSTDKASFSIEKNSIQKGRKNYKKRETSSKIYRNSLLKQNHLNLKAFLIKKKRIN